MNVFITGATGFIGGNLVEKLTKKGWRVSALVRKTSRVSMLKKKSIKLVLGDIRDPAGFRDKLKGIDLVINCAAALPHHKLPDKQYWLTNVNGVENLLSNCIQSKVKKVIHLSTVGIYGETNKQGLSEKSKVKVNDVYSKTKLEGEKIVRDYTSKGLKTVIIRPTIAYGPGDTRPVFFKLFRLIGKGRFVPIGKGDNYLHTIYVENLIDAILLAASKNLSSGEDFIIGDATCPKVKDIIGTIYHLYGKQKPRFYLPRSFALTAARFFDLLANRGLPTPLTTKSVKFITAEKRFKINKAKKLLGYNSKVSLAGGMRKTFNWYKANKYL